MAELEILAPSDSHEKLIYKNKQGVKINDYTSLDPQVKSYLLVFNKKKDRR